jgi:hypothetical protein
MILQLRGEKVLYTSYTPGELQLKDIRYHEAGKEPPLPVVVQPAS